MMSYDGFVLGINEGLILTHELSKCKNIINKCISELGFWVKPTYDIENNTFNVEFDGVPQKNHLYLFQIINNLGYYPSYYNSVSKNDMIKNFPWIDIESYIEQTKNKKSITMFFESKFDETLKWKPKKLYHISPEKNFYRIKNKV